MGVLLRQLCAVLCVAALSLPLRAAELGDASLAMPGVPRLPAKTTFPPAAVNFDGTNDSMALGGGITGIADGKAGTISFWIRSGADGGAYRILHIAVSATGLVGMAIDKNASDQIEYFGRNAAGTLIFDTHSSNDTVEVADGWVHVMGAWDLAAGTQQLYVDQVSDAVVATNTNDTIDYAQVTPETSFGARVIGGTPDMRVNADIAEFWFHPSFLDLSVLTNRRKFITADGQPVYLGRIGELPLNGTQPLVFLRRQFGAAATTFAVNLGTSGQTFTITGTLGLTAGAVP